MMNLRKRATIRISLCRSFPGELREILDRRHARRRELFRIFVTQLVERERALPGDLQRSRERVWNVGIDLLKDVQRPEMPFGIRLQRSAGLSDCRVQTDGR